MCVDTQSLIIKLKCYLIQHKTIHKQLKHIYKTKNYYIPKILRLYFIKNHDNSEIIVDTYLIKLLYTQPYNKHIDDMITKILIFQNETIMNLQISKDDIDIKNLLELYNLRVEFETSINT
jgi:hypothetical protein